MKVSKAGLSLIKAHEGYRRRAAKLADGRWVMGYSHLKTAEKGKQVTKPEAEELLVADLGDVETLIHEHVHAPLTQAQFDALASFAFSVGERAFRLSGVVRHINAGRIIDAAGAFDVYRRARIDGELVVVDSLVRRRAAEKARFLKLDGGPMPTSRAVLQAVADPDAVNGAPADTPTSIDVDLEGDAAQARRAAVSAHRAASEAANEAVSRLRKIMPEPAAEASAPGAIASRAEDAPKDRAPDDHDDEPPTSIGPSAPFDVPAPYPIRREGAVRPSRPIRLEDWDAFAEAETYKRNHDPKNDNPGRGFRLADALETESFWSWALGIFGVGLLAAAVTMMRSFAAEPPGPFEATAWPAAATAGALCIAGSAYLAVRRIAGFDDA